MRFLLVAVNAKFIHSNPAIYSLRACVGEKARSHVELAEYTINQYPSRILADIYRRKPDAIGFSCYIWNWKLIRELLQEIPKLLPRTALWLGGPEVSCDAAAILREYPQLTGIMVGEGEETFRELMAYYLDTHSVRGDISGDGTEPETFPMSDNVPADNVESGKDPGSGNIPSLTDVPGLCLPSGYTASRLKADLDNIPFLYEDPAPFENRILYYESARGCPFRCSYCLSSLDRRVRLRNLETVKRELQFFLDKKVKQVKFVDRTFNCNREHALGIWQYLLEHDNGVTNFHFEIAGDLLGEEEIALLNRFRPGLVQLEMGVQSCNPRTLQAIRRTMDLERLDWAVASIGQTGNVHRHLDLIAGLPWEDYASFRASFNRVYRMGPEQLQLGFLKVLKGSEMAKRAREYGICYQGQPPYEVLYTRWLSYEDVLHLKGIEEMVELYYNSRQFTHTMPFLEQAFESPFAMYEALAAFYERNGYFENSPARVYRYQVLLAFAREYDGGREAAYRELLVYDLYLRENMKSRPEFAMDLSGYREKLKGFYRSRDFRQQYLPGYDGYDSRQLEKMTHMEVFNCPVWDREKMAGWQESYGQELYFVLFDYRRRDPVSGEADSWCVMGQTPLDLPDHTDLRSKDQNDAFLHQH